MATTPDNRSITNNWMTIPETSPLTEKLTAERKNLSYQEYADYNQHPVPEESFYYNDKPYLVTLNGDIADIVEPLSVTGEEAISSLYTFTVMVKAQESLATIMSHIGSPLAVTVSVDKEKRVLHGIIDSIEQLRADNDFTARQNPQGTYYTETLYALTLQPQLNDLKKNRVYRVHAEKTALEVVTDILREHHVDYNDTHLSKAKNAGSYARVQYEQSDYDFIHQLLHSEEIFYCFEHSQNGHTMVFYDDVRQFTSLDTFGYNPVPFHKKPLSKLNQTQIQVPSSIKINGYHFENNEFLFAEGKPVKTTASVNKYASVYCQTDSMIDNKAQLESQLTLQTSQLTAQAVTNTITSYSPELSPGKFFKLDLSNKAAEIEQRYFISAAKFSIKQSDLARPLKQPGFLFSSILTIHQDGEPYYPPVMSAARKIHEHVSAIVVGPEEEALHADKYGRVQIRFLWQPEENDQFDTAKYCWARVNQFWSGRNMGAQFLPRVGSEVLVSFLGGNASFPVVIGCLFNGSCPPPFDLQEADQQSCSGIRSHNPVKGSATDGHKLCFQDKPEEEYVALHSQRDLRFSADNDKTITVKQNMSTTIEEGNHLLSVNTGNHELKVVKGHHQINVEKGDHTFVANTGNYKVEVKEGKVNVDARGEIEISSETNLTLKVANSKIVITPEEIVISAPKIAVNAQGELELSAKGIVKIHGAEINLN
ncbi:type VI secretion system Vgr family protein [Enterobacteriaceae bacterium LUAb1]